MSVLHIKLIAIITMILDHIGLFFFPDQIYLRILGRLSFPLFAWLIANGAYHTHNISKYLQRLFLLAIISQVPFYSINHLSNPNFNILNVFFTLSIGLGAILMIRQTSLKIHWILISIGCVLIAAFLKTDYGGFGVLSIISYYVFYKNWKYLMLSQISIYLTMSIYYLIFNNYLGVFELFGLCSLIIISFYNKKEGLKMKYFFYLFYPMHYIIIYLLKLFL